MKIIHTSDWHLGRIFCGMNMIDDQEYILNKLICILEAEKPDVLVISGDIYDRAVTTEQAVRLLNDIIMKIVSDLNIKTIIISGNHDSGERLNFGSRLLRKNGLYIASSIESYLENIVIEDNEGFVNFWTIPYYSPSLIKSNINQDVHSHDDVYRVLSDNIKQKINVNERNILITHAFIAGGESTEESESPLSVGGSSSVSADFFNIFDYTALGHLHKPQKIRDGKIRYSGSILQYSFSEVSHIKSVSRIEIGEKGDLKTSEINLIPKHPLRIIEGIFDDIYQNAPDDKNRDDYIKIVLTDKSIVFNPKERLKEFYPNILQLERSRLEPDSSGRQKGIGREINRITDRELFLRFYKDMTHNEFNSENEWLLSELLEEFSRNQAGEE
jgi:DNA repair protein SbcD/Mre11